jgi:hypothetical protein
VTCDFIDRRFALFTDAERPLPELRRTELGDALWNLPAGVVPRSPGVGVVGAQHPLLVCQVPRRPPGLPDHPPRPRPPAPPSAIGALLQDLRTEGERLSTALRSVERLVAAFREQQPPAR